MSRHAEPAHPPQPSTSPTPATLDPPPSAQQAKPRGRRVLIGAGILVAFIAVYALSLFGVHLLAKSSEPLKPPDMNTTDDTVVQIRLEELKPTLNRLSVKVLVRPQDNMVNQRLDVLTEDTAVRMDPPNDLGDLVYPAESRRRRSPPPSRRVAIPITGRLIPTRLKFFPPMCSSDPARPASTYPPVSR